MYLPYILYSTFTYDPLYYKIGPPLLWIIISIWDFKYYTQFFHFEHIIVKWACAVLKSGYSDYPKSGYIRTIWPTENWCPKFGYSNSEKNTIFRAFFHDFFCFCIYFFWELSFFQFLHSFCSRIAAKNEEKILLRKIVRMMRT